MIRLGVPSPGQVVPVALPDEITRAEVLEVRSDDEILVKLNVIVPMSKTHSYKFGDSVSCRRSRTMLGEKWEAQRG